MTSMPLSSAIPVGLAAWRALPFLRGDPVWLVGGRSGNIDAMIREESGTRMAADNLIDAAKQAGVASFEATFGRVPENFRLLAEHAPGAFAGYGLIRSTIMRDRAAGGALDLKTKELIFALLDTLIGQKTGAKNHAAAALRLGLTLPELAEGLVQVVMAGGITTWNETGADVMRHCVELSAATPAPSGS